MSSKLTVHFPMLVSKTYSKKLVFYYLVFSEVPVNILKNHSLNPSEFHKNLELWGALIFLTLVHIKTKYTTKMKECWKLS